MYENLVYEKKQEFLDAKPGRRSRRQTVGTSCGVIEHRHIVDEFDVLECARGRDYQDDRHRRHRVDRAVDQPIPQQDEKDAQLHVRPPDCAGSKALGIVTGIDRRIWAMPLP